MSTAQDYRKIAENQRRLAALSDFPMMRDRYIASADRWDSLAQEKSLIEPAELDRMTRKLSCKEGHRAYRAGE